MKLVGFAVLALFPAMTMAQTPDSNAVWHEFTTRLRAGNIVDDDLRPYYPQLREPMLRFLDSFRRNSRPEDWDAKPELHAVGDQLHGIVTLTGADGKKVPYCFTLLVQDARWYFQHVESIFIRLDRLGPLPASHFPDVTEAQKAWMRDERRLTEQIKVYNLLAKEKGREFARRLFQDGAGYALEARTWVPFVRPSKAFILFLCWEQANLFGSPVTLDSLDDTAALVRLETRWFRLYRQTAHIRQLIGEAEYRELFELNWRDRARAAGWKLQIEYHGDECVLRFDR
jgi:hypothetical protein